MTINFYIQKAWVNVAEVQKRLVFHRRALDRTFLSFTTSDPWFWGIASASDEVGFKLGPTP